MNKIKKIVCSIILVLIFLMGISVDASTIIETTNPDDEYDTIADGTFVVGITKFNPDVIVTAGRVAKATFNDVLYNHDKVGYSGVGIYYYTSGYWFKFDEQNNAEEIAPDNPMYDQINSPDIYYVNNQEKILFAPYIRDLADGVSLVFETDNNKDVVYQDSILRVPATVRSINIYEQTGDAEPVKVGNLSRSSENDDVFTKTKYPVTFNKNNGEEASVLYVEAGDSINDTLNGTDMWDDHENDGFDFVEWRLNGVAFDYDTPIVNPVTLEAIYELSIPTPVIAFGMGDDHFVLGMLIENVDDYCFSECDDSNSNKYRVDGYTVYEKNGSNYTEVFTEIFNQPDHSFISNLYDEVDDKIYVARMFVTRGQGRKYSKYSNELELYAAPDESACYQHGNQYAWGHFRGMEGYTKAMTKLTEGECVAPQTISHCYHDSSSDTYIWTDEPEVDWELVSCVENMSQCVAPAPLCVNPTSEEFNGIYTNTNGSTIKIYDLPENQTHLILNGVEHPDGNGTTSIYIEADVIAEDGVIEFGYNGYMYSIAKLYDDIVLITDNVTDFPSEDYTRTGSYSMAAYYDDAFYGDDPAYLAEEQYNALYTANVDDTIVSMYMFRGDQDKEEVVFIGANGYRLDLRFSINANGELSYWPGNDLYTITYDSDNNSFTVVEYDEVSGDVVSDSPVAGTYTFNKNLTMQSLINEIHFLDLNETVVISNNEK